MNKKVDSWFLGIVITLIIIGFFIFFSASLGLLARQNAQFSGVLFNQIFSLFLGGVAFFITLKVNYRLFKKYSLHFFLASLFLTVAVFIPGIGFEHGGAQRWISIGSFSLQPAELLKISFILYFATWLSAVRTKVRTYTYGLIPLAVLTGIVGILLLKQPDTGTFIVIFGTAVAMFIASGAPWRHIFISGGAAFGGIAVLALTRPYIRERMITFLNPALDPQGAGYQIQQSLIAVGSGEMFGRGFGQGVQKFQYLPEPIGDSIFAVFAEEFGFIGSILLLTLFTLFALKGISMAKKAPNHFSRLTIIGIVILITGQAFLNIGAMLSIFPLTGIPLPFISHGGSALIVTLAAMGIVLNISKYSSASR